MPEALSAAAGALLMALATLLLAFARRLGNSKNGVDKHPARIVRWSPEDRELFHQCHEELRGVRTSVERLGMESQRAVETLSAAMERAVADQRQDMAAVVGELKMLAATVLETSRQAAEDRARAEGYSRGREAASREEERRHNRERRDAEG